MRLLQKCGCVTATPKAISVDERRVTRIRTLFPLNSQHVLYVSGTGLCSIYFEGSRNVKCPSHHSVVAHAHSATGGVNEM